jgi:hypothetical protein
LSYENKKIILIIDFIQITPNLEAEPSLELILEVLTLEKNLKKYDTCYGKSEGKYKFHTGGERTDLYVDECDIKELYIIQNRTNGSGKCNLYLDKNFRDANSIVNSLGFPLL